MRSFPKEVAVLVARKTVTLLIVLLLVLTIEFLFLRVGTDDSAYLPRGYTQPRSDAVRELLHLNDSVAVQYFYYIVDMLSGEGYYDVMSYTSHTTVGRAIHYALPHTMILFLSALLLSLLFGFLAAYAVGRTENRLGKRISMATMFFIWAVPVIFISALFLIQIVWRFDIAWAVSRVDVPGPGWFDQFLFDLRLRVFPFLVLALTSFGGFALMTLQGMRTTSYGPAGEDSKRKPSFSECVLSVMPSMKLNIALMVSSLIYVEVFWSLDGLGLRLLTSMVNFDRPLMEVCVFLIVLLVLVSGFMLDLAFSILALWSSHKTSPAPAESSPPSSSDGGTGVAVNPLPGDLFGEFRWFASQYMKSVIGVVGTVLLLAVAVLAIIGPIIVEPYNPGSLGSDPDPVSEFLYGFRTPFVQILAILVLSLIIGYTAAVLTLPLGRFNYPVVLIAESLLAFPVVGIILIGESVWLGNWNVGWHVVTLTVLVTWAPIALVVLRKGKNVNDSYSARFPAEGGLARYRGVVTESIPNTLPDAVATLKFVVVVAMLSILLMYGYYGIEGGSWGSMIAHSVQEMLLFDLDIWWILPLVGSMIMMSAFYLVLEATQCTLEKRFRRSVLAKSP